MSQRNEKLLTIAFCIYAVSTLISMAVMSIGAGLLALGMLFAFSGPRALFRRIGEGLKTSVTERRYLWISLALAIICVSSLIYARFFPLSYDGKFSQVHILKDSFKLWYLFWPLVLLAGLRSLSKESRDRILITWIGFSAILGVIAVIQHYTGWPRPQAIPFESGPLRYHATLFLGHHLTVASVIIFPFFASLDFAWRALKSRTTPGALPAWMWGVAAVLGATTLFLTYSRTLWAALPLACLLWFFMNLPRKVSIALAVVLIVGMGFATQLPSVRGRFNKSAFAEGLLPREHLWEANLDFARNRPLLGVGWKHNQELSGYYLMEKTHSQDVFSGNAHDDLLDMLGGTGLLGAVAWILWCLLVWAVAWQAWRKKDASSTLFASGLFCAWVAFQLNGLTQVNFWDAKVTHQIMWMVAWSLLWLSPERVSSAEEVRENSIVTA